MHRSIGIIGGFGPRITFALVAEVLQQFRVRKGTGKVCEFPSIHVLGLGAPGDINDIRTAIMERRDLLLRAGADVLAIEHPSAEIFLNPGETLASIGIINSVDATCARVHETPLKEAVLLASRPLIHARLYQRKLGGRGVAVTVPPEDIQFAVDALVDNVNDYRSCEVELGTLQEYISHKCDGQQIIFGAPELCIVEDQIRSNLAAINCLQALSVAIADAYAQIT